MPPPDDDACSSCAALTLPEPCHKSHKRTHLLLSGMIAVCLLFAACETLAPDARAVRVASSDADVAGCTMLGTVTSEPPYVGPSDAMTQLKNNTAALGGNVLYLTSTGATKGRRGVAYRCESETP